MIKLAWLVSIIRPHSSSISQLESQPYQTHIRPRITRLSHTTSLVLVVVAIFRGVAGLIKLVNALKLINSTFMHSIIKNYNNTQKKNDKLKIAVWRVWVRIRARVWVEVEVLGWNEWKCPKVFKNLVSQMRANGAQLQIHRYKHRYRYI